MMLLDYHSHTNITQTDHAVGTMEDYVKQAISCGLAEYGFSEHLFISQMNEATANKAKFSNLRILQQAGVAPLIKLFKDYVVKIQKLQEQYPQIKLKIGIEIDYIPEHTELLRAILAEFPFDYVIGSIHYLDGWGFDNPAEKDGFSTRDINEIYRQYLTQIERCAQSGLVDIIGHLDLVKIFGHRPTKDIMPTVEKTIKAIAASNIAVELNTAGLRKPVGEIYPQPAWLQLCYQNRIPVTLGSDAHQPKDVGAGFEQAIALLKKVGYTQLASFTKRKRTLIPIIE
ncbi:MAG: histidinol-phosphatase HisJ family protein [bacterium]